MNTCAFFPQDKTKKEREKRMKQNKTITKKKNTEHLNFSIASGSWVIDLRGALHPWTKSSMFCVLSQNHILINNVCILKQIVQGTQKWHWNFSTPRGFLSYGSKHSKYCFNQELKSCLAYLNFNAIFEFLYNYTMNVLVSKRCWEFL